MIEAKIAIETSSSKLDITSKLNLAVGIAMKLDQSEEIYELPHISIDQLFAIFGSLIFPLLAPIIKNSFSEIKRYRDLTK